MEVIYLLATVLSRWFRDMYDTARIGWQPRKVTLESCTRAKLNLELGLQFQVVCSESGYRGARSSC